MTAATFSGTRVLFAFVGSRQYLAMRAIQRESSVPSVLVDLAGGQALEDDLDSGVDAGTFEHLMQPGVRGLFESLFLSRRLKSEGMQPDVVVLGQDIGAPARAFAQAFIRSGASYALLQDGALAFPGVTNRIPLLRRAETLLATARLLRPTSGHFGSSRPDVILTWGHGWTELFTRSAPGVALEACGWPPHDLLSADTACPKEFVLVCSQPVWLPAFGLTNAEVSGYYSALTELTHVPGVKIRLHPIERSEHQHVPESLLRADTSKSMTFETQMQLASAVCAPASSTLVEAGAAGVGVAPLDYGQRFAVVRSNMVGISHLSVGVDIGTTKPSDFAAVCIARAGDYRARGIQEVLQDFVRTDGSCTIRAARVIDLLAAR